MPSHSRPLRIAFIAYRGNMNCGGQGVYLWFLARELTRLGHEVEVFVGPPYPDPMPFASAVHALPNKQHWAKWFGRDYGGMIPRERPWRALSPLALYETGASYFGFLPEPFAFSCRAFRAVAARMQAGKRWDLVHDVQCLGWGVLGLRSLGLPVVCTVHHPLSVDRRMSFVRDVSLRDAIGTMTFYPIGMQAAVARRIDRVLTSSEASARQIADDFGVKPSQIRNVWNGIDTALYSPDAAVEKNENEVLCVGRAGDPNKGVRLLIEAFAKLPSRLRLTLVDNDHPGNEIFAWAREAGVAERLTVTGRLTTPELVHCYRRAAIAVVPSHHEGFGLPAVEAMACGTPAVTTDAGALPEVVGLSGGGVVVPRGNAPALADAILALAEDPERRAALAAKGRRGVEAQLSWASVASTTVTAYEEVLAAR